MAHSLTRYAENDDVLPLTEPLQTTRGIITEIPVLKGQVINISIYGYNRFVFLTRCQQWAAAYNYHF